MGTLPPTEPDVRFLRYIGVGLMAATITVGVIAGSMILDHPLDHTVAVTQPVGQIVADLGN